MLDNFQGVINRPVTIFVVFKFFPEVRFVQFI